MMHASQSRFSSGCELVQARRALGPRPAAGLVITARAQRKGRSKQGAQKQAGLSAAETVAVAVSAVALPSLVATPAAYAQGESVDLAVNSAIQAVKSTGSAVKVGLDAALTAFQYAKQAFDQAAPVVKDAADTVSPYAKSAYNVASQAAKPLAKAAQPYVEGSLGQVDQFLQQQGLNTKVVVQTAQDASLKAGDALTAAQPSVSSTVTTLSATDPTILAEYALGLVTLYYLGPPLIKGLFGAFRGYAGNVSPAAALDAVSNEANVYIIDIRSDKEKEQAGLPDIPRGDRLVELEYAEVADRKLRNQLRNVPDLERTVTVLQIASLKKVNNGSRLLLLDRNGGQSKGVAKELARRGFKKAFVISGGFSSWVGAKLQTKGSTSVSSALVLPFGGTVRTSGNSSSGQTRRSPLALPSGR